MRFGIALSGGGIRGLSHAGALKALEDNNIKIDAIGGTSSGSIVATLYAMGISPYYIYILSKKYAKDVIGESNFAIISEIGNFVANKKIKLNGFKSGEKIEKAFNEIAKKRGVKTIKDISMPLVIPAVDISESKKYVFTSIVPEEDTKYINDISVGKAIRASCSFPVVFSPCEYNEHIFMDGGILDNTPALEIKKFNIDKILSIKFDSDKITSQSNVMDIVMKTIDIMGNKISEESLASSDLTLTIPTDGTGLLEVEKLDMCYKEGYNIITENIDKIKELLKE